jgi:hypothetical protein
MRRMVLFSYLMVAVVLPAVAFADSAGTMSGDVAAVTDRYVDIVVKRQTVRFALGDEFTGIYSWDERKKLRLADVKPAMFVRVFFNKTVVGSAYRKATKIDVLLRSNQAPLPIPT